MAARLMETLGLDPRCPCSKPYLNLLLSGMDVRASCQFMRSAVHKKVTPDEMRDHVFLTLLYEYTMQDMRPTQSISFYSHVAKGCSRSPSHIVTEKEEDGTPMIKAGDMADKAKEAYQKYLEEK